MTDEVKILTTAVIECQRANMKKSAMECCYVLMKPEFRCQLDEKYKNTIETMVRKGGKAKLEDPPDEMTPCPNCEKMFPNFSIGCIFCRTGEIFCLASGRHLVADDLTACPKCDFPALKSEFIKVLKQDPHCPLCKEEVDHTRIFLINDMRPYIDRP